MVLLTSGLGNRRCGRRKMIFVRNNLVVGKRVASYSRRLLAVVGSRYWLWSYVGPSGDQRVSVQAVMFAMVNWCLAVVQGTIWSWVPSGFPSPAIRPMANGGGVP